MEGRGLRCPLYVRRPPRWNAVDPERDAGACQAGRRQAAFDSSGVWVIKYRARLKGGPQVV